MARKEFVEMDFLAIGVLVVVLIALAALTWIGEYKKPGLPG
jgi:hypothetical protein